MRIIISEQERKSILSLHESYGYKSLLSEQPEQPEQTGLEQGTVQLDGVEISVPSTASNLTVNVSGGGLINKKLPGSKVTLVNNNGKKYEGTTDDKGVFKFEKIPVRYYKEGNTNPEDALSSYTLNVVLDGFENFTQKFEKLNSGKNEIKVSLKELPTNKIKPDNQTPEEPKTPQGNEEPKDRRTIPSPGEVLANRPLSKRSMERLNNKVLRELQDALKKKTMVFYQITSEKGDTPLNLEIDKGKTIVSDVTNPAVVSIPTTDGGKIMFDCNQKPIVIMRMGEESYKSRNKFNGEPYYQIHMPKELGDEWVVENYCQKLASKLQDGRIVAPFDRQ